ncbi:MAG: hypothetical protein F6K22_24145, partial [Okeania sp. SIO2F4]|uniref:hypothetical protein n=1 Tax=Okeania sp. SIO2F4 TaxID=2607790 RepID=UPI00142CAEE6
RMEVIKKLIPNPDEYQPNGTAEKICQQLKRKYYHKEWLVVVYRPYDPPSYNGNKQKYNAEHWMVGKNYVFHYNLRKVNVVVAWRREQSFANVPDKFKSLYATFDSSSKEYDPANQGYAVGLAGRLADKYFEMANGQYASNVYVYFHKMFYEDQKFNGVALWVTHYDSRCFDYSIYGNYHNLALMKVGNGTAAHWTGIPFKQNGNPAVLFTQFEMKRYPSLFKKARLDANLIIFDDHLKTIGQLY